MAFTMAAPPALTHVVQTEVRVKPPPLHLYALSAKCGLPYSYVIVLLLGPVGNLRPLEMDVLLVPNSGLEIWRGLVRNTKLFTLH